MLTEESQKQKVQTLNNSDRCDRCNAQAFVWVNGVSGELFFCSHHFNKWEKAIKEFAFEIIDERNFIK